MDIRSQIPLVSKNVSRTDSCKRYSFRHLQNVLIRRICKGYQDYNSLLKIASYQDLVLVVGADNYDVAYHQYDTMHYLNSRLKKYVREKLFYLIAL